MQALNRLKAINIPFAVILLLLVSSSFSSFSQELRYERVEDISYYKEEDLSEDKYRQERCKLDFYYPTNKKGFSTIVWFHGGGLTGGDKEIPKVLLEKGHAIIGVGYRLSPQAKGKDIIEDASAAVAWVFENIKEYGGDDRLIFVSGHSAGGYLGMMLTLDKHYLKKYGIDANRIAGLIPFSGQTITHFTIRNEQGIEEIQPTVDQYAPLFHVRADAPPLLLITGGRELELLGRYEENAYMARMMKLSGHQSTQIIELEGYGHDMTYPAFPLLLKEVERRSKELL
ncbi:alpha/beta hydrolase [Olivibacter sp. SDN3]|uniref:alpha/beta hydrolase n=1 Tax=Olivibacter sp. SDN3 TaxID=2764720 RepID=UPI001651401C|nr:alpha/beta hydrolase [Olivibacter sp. SDN3]QNL49409.1 alpha/beta hydrolase [Olivibacter sp. SDN3]